MKQHNASRRRFMQQGTALTAAGMLGTPLMFNLAATGEAHASDGSDYKALVCIHLDGGNDALGTVFPADDTTWQTYWAQRKDLLSARESYHVIQKSPSDVTPFCLHPSLVKVKGLYDSRRLAIVGNVGPLHEALTRDTYNGSRGPRNKPPKLFSHNDQTAIWLTGMPDGVHAEGWGGGLLVQAGQTTSDDMFSAVSVNGSTPFLSARTGTYGAGSQVVSPYGVGERGALPLCSAYEKGLAFGVFNQRHLSPVWMGSTRVTHDMQRDVAAVTAKANRAWNIMKRQGLAPVSAAPENSGDLRKQLHVVAEMIKASGSSPEMNSPRQVFFVRFGGFDTHTNQRARQNDLLRELDEGLSYFDNLLGDRRDKVTTFTTSDFGRKLRANSSGSDHGWGGHHIVMGGVLSGGKGGQVLGFFPDVGLNAQGQYRDSRMLEDGTLIPTIPIANYIKPMATWFGATNFEYVWYTLNPQQGELPGFPAVNFG